MANRDELREPEPSSRAAPPRAVSVLTGVAGFTVVAFGLFAIRSVAAPVALAAVLVICVNPIRPALLRRRVPPALATGAVIVTGFALVAAFAVAFVAAIAQFAALLPAYVPELRAAEAAVAELLGLGAGALQASLDPARLVAALGALAGGVAGLVSFAVILLTCILLMGMDSAYQPLLVRHLRVARPALARALGEFAPGVRRYMVVTTALGAAQGLLNWLALVLLGVPGGPLWGLLSFLCSFIPNVGYFIAIVPPLVFGYLEGGWGTVVAIVVVYGIINGGVQSVVQPRVVGDAVSLSQTLTFVSVLFWAVVLGPVGAILSIPLTLLVRTLLLDAGPDAPVWRPLTGDVRGAGGGGRARRRRRSGGAGGAPAPRRDGG